MILNAVRTIGHIFEKLEQEMESDRVSEEKVIGAFKGLINTYLLKPYDAKFANEVTDYQATFNFFESEDDQLHLFYQKRALERLVDIVNRSFPGQIDKAEVSSLLNEATTEWIEQGHGTEDQQKLEDAGNRFLQAIKLKIRNYILYIPVDGLMVATSQSLQLGRCYLYRNNSDSELMQLARIRREMMPKETEDFLSSVEKAQAFLKVEVSGHFKRASKVGRDEAELSLNLLRLFLGSAYFNLYPVAQRTGLVGSLHSGRHGDVIGVLEGIPIEEQFPSSSVEIEHNRPFELKNDTIQSMMTMGLDNINQNMLSLDAGNGNDVARRLLRAASWFGKATSSSAVVDGFLMYAISVESLLSEGRTPQDVYAIQMAALVTRDATELIYPMDGYLSRKFSRDLKGSSDRNGRFNIVKNRIVKLFAYRNDVAHGRVLEEELDSANLLDMETLVRNTILSFLCGGWCSLGDFRDWVNHSISYRFSPESTNNNAQT